MKFHQINYLTDSVMPQAKPNTFKVIMVVARATWGWKKDCAQISFNDFQKATGISGRSTLNSAIKDALGSGFVERREEANSFCYLMIGTETVPNETEGQYGNSTNDSTETVLDQYGNSTDSGTETVPNHSTAKEIKETIKETIKEGDSPCSFADAIAAYENNIAVISPTVSDDIGIAVDEVGAKWVIDAVKIAARKNVKNWSYISAILKNWQALGYQDIKRSTNGRSEHAGTANEDGSFY